MQIRARRAFMATRPRARKRMPKQLQPDAVRLEYSKSLIALLRAAHRMVQQRLYPEIPALVREAGRADAAHMDAMPPGKRVNLLMQKLAEDYYDTVATPKVLEDVAEKYAARTSSFQREQLNKQVHSVVGIDILHTEPNLVPLVQAFTSENVALIKSVSQTYFGDIEKRMLAGLRTGERAESMVADFEGRFGVSESSALRIANDQIGKLYGDLNSTRQQALGVESFVWETSNDERVRESHAELQGETFRWDDPPEVDGEIATPGSSINCRCNAAPDLSAILDSLE